MYICDGTIERFIKEDIPYIDLTTELMGIGKTRGKIYYKAREKMVLSGVEEVKRLFKKLNITTTFYCPSGTTVEAGEMFLEAEGLASDLHMAWKVSLNILEYCCGIATRTRNLVNKAKNIPLLTTRKSFPGTKELAIKSIIAGGGHPHRLGLSETILVFKQHMAMIGGINELPTYIETMRSKACEKKILVEVETLEEAMLMVDAKVDGLQFDKISPETLKEIVDKIRGQNQAMTLLAAGGINASNIENYTTTGIDGIVTTAPYFGKPADIKVVIEPQ